MSVLNNHGLGGRSCAGLKTLFIVAGVWVCAGGWAGGGAEAHGAIDQTLSCQGRGRMKNAATHNGYLPTNNYVVGLDEVGSTHRNYFGFAIPSAPAPGLSIIAATLRVNAWDVRIAAGSTVDFTLFDTALAPGFAASAATWSDLADGHALGFHAFTAAESLQMVNIPLNAAGLSALNLGIGGTTIMGGSITAPPSAVNTHYAFGISSGNAADVTLNITWDVVPAPGAGGMAAALCVAGGALSARRRRVGV